MDGETQLFTNLGILYWSYDFKGVSMSVSSSEAKPQYLEHNQRCVVTQSAHQSFSALQVTYKSWRSCHESCKLCAVCLEAISSGEAEED